MANVTSPVLLDDTLSAIADAVEEIGRPVIIQNQYGSWKKIKDDKLPELMAQVDTGDIDLTNDLGWESGDERTVTLTTGEEITIILTDPEHYTLANATESGQTKCNFTLVLKACLNTTHNMNSSATNSGSWNSSAMRTWLNGTVINYLPAGLKSILKEFNVITATEYNASTLTTSVDKLALFAEKEVQGSRTYSNTTEANALTQLDYFKTSSNKIKTVNGSASYWWLRSPYSDDTGYFCI